MIVLTWFIVDESKDSDAVKTDVQGVATFSGFPGLLTWTLISGNREGWLNFSIAARFGGSMILFVAFLLVETRQARPMVDLQYFRRRTYPGTNIVGISYPVALLTMLT